MNQKQQLRTLEEFKQGQTNILIATSVGEEGLDIGEVDLIICYDSSASPIQMIQRMGRTGRQRAGRVVILSYGKFEHNQFMMSKDKESVLFDRIKNGRFVLFDQNPRLLP